MPLKQFWNSVQLNKIFSKRKRSAFSYDILNTHHSHHHNHQHSFKLSLISNLLKCSSQRIVCVFYPFDGQQVRGQSETKQIEASTAPSSYIISITSTVIIWFSLTATSSYDQHEDYHNTNIIGTKVVIKINIKCHTKQIYSSQVVFTKLLGK